MKHVGALQLAKATRRASAGEVHAEGGKRLDMRQSPRVRDVGMHNLPSATTQVLQPTQRPAGSASAPLVDLHRPVRGRMIFFLRSNWSFGSPCTCLQLMFTCT